MTLAEWKAIINNAIDLYGDDIEMCVTLKDSKGKVWDIFPDEEDIFYDGKDIEINLEQDIEDIEEKK